MLYKIIIVTYDGNGNQHREYYAVDAFPPYNSEKIITNNCWTCIQSDRFGDFYLRDNQLIFIDLDVDGIVPDGYKYITVDELGKLLI